MTKGQMKLHGFLCCNRAMLLRLAPQWLPLWHRFELHAQAFNDKKVSLATEAKLIDQYSK